VRDLATERTSAHSFHELDTTDLNLNKFLIGKAAWEKRAPLAARTLRDDRKGQVHKSYTGPSINNLRLTNKSARAHRIAAALSRARTRVHTVAPSLACTRRVHSRASARASAHAHPHTWVANSS
jgi:hypothetical protein